MCRALNYFEHFLVFVSVVNRCVSDSAFTSLASLSVGIASSAVELNICATTAEIIKYNSIIKKKRKKHDDIVLLGKVKENIIEILIFKALIDSYINHDKFFSVNNVLKQYDQKEEEIKYPENVVENMLCQL